MAKNLFSKFGRIARDLPFTPGRIFVVAPSSEAYSADLKNWLGADEDGNIVVYDTLLAAYNACTDNNDDVILLTGHSNHEVAAGIAWTKSRIHVIGLDGGDRLFDQGSKIHMGGAIATAYVLYITGTRNTFKNIKFIQGSTAATALTVVKDSGEGTLYKNCSFIFEVADNLGGTTAHEFLAGNDSATFRECTFGADTLLTSGARSVFHIKADTTEFKSNQLVDCTFLISSSSSTATFIRLDAITSILFTNLFKRCSFIASVDTAGGAAVAEAVQTGTGTNKGVLCFDQCGFFNCTKVSTATSGRNAAIQIVGPASSATGSLGITPTA